MAEVEYDRLKRLVGEALDLPAVERDAYLVFASEGDSTLLGEARDLLAFDRESIIVPPLPLPSLPILAGQTIGRYRLLDLLGEGGMGLVYLADQLHPVKRRVALKIIKFGMDSREVIARFASESQALALMDHPNIATVLDAGAAPDGRPYFVMELIRGEPITAYCTGCNLDLRARLELFVLVCRAVNHAHQKGIIHRDVKPSNLLIAQLDGRPVPKVIDFGIARALDKRVLDETLCTQLGRMIGTPEYMSPEQADPVEQDIDTRTDVYSLGVVLYELLTGDLPVERAILLRGGLEGLRRLIRDSDPLRPSLRAATRSSASSVATCPVPASRLRGDLDWITMRALEKDRDRRYDSAAALADDVDRYLRQQPVLAGPPSTVYRVRKYARRHRIATTSVLIILAALLLGGTGTTIGMVRALRAERAARLEAQRSESGRLYQMARSSTDPLAALAYAIAALELDDSPQNRLLAERVMAQCPPQRLMPMAPSSHNPHRPAFSPDGRWIAVGWTDRGALQLYDRAGGEPVELHGHTSTITRVVFSADSRLLVTASTDSTVRIWSPREARLVRTLRTAGNPRPFLVPGESDILVVVARIGEPNLWQWWPLDGDPPRDIGTTGPVLRSRAWPPQPDVDPSGTWVAQPDGRRVLLFHLHDLAASPREVGVHDQNVSGAVFAPDGKRLLSYDGLGHGILWDISRPEIPILGRYDGPPNTFSASFDPEGRHLAIGGAGPLCIWDLYRPAGIQPLMLSGVYWTFEAAFDPRREWIITTGDTRRIVAWSWKQDPPIVLQVPENVVAVPGFSPDGKWLTLATWDGSLQVWPLDGGRIGAPRKLLHLENHEFWSVAFDDQSRYLFASVCNSVEGDGTLIKIPLDGSPPTILDGASCDITVDPQGRYVGASGYTFASIIDTETGEIRDLTGPNGGAKVALGFLPDGRLLAYGAAGLGLWDPHSGNLQRLGPSPRWASLCRDRLTMLSLGDDGQFRRGPYNRPGTPVALDFDWSRLTSMAIVDSTGSVLAIGTEDGVLEVLDLDCGMHHALPIYSKNCSFPVVDPKRRWIASAGDGLVKLMPIPTGPSVETMSRDDYLTRVRGWTNLRSVRESVAEAGYRLEGRAVPDWANPPRQ